MGERIRLRYVGLVTLVAKIFGMFGGLAFIILVIRRLSVTDLGTWQWISRTVGYAAIPVGIVNFWVWRFVARDRSNSRTALVLNSCLSIPFLIIYLALSPMLAETVQAATFPFLLGALLVPINYLVMTMWTVAAGAKPQNAAFSEMAYETVKISLGFVLVFVLNLALVGAILSLELSSLFQFLLLVVLLKRYLGGTFKKDVAKQWLSYSWLSAYITQSLILVSLDAVVVVMLTGAQATTVLAYFGVASTIGLMVGVPVALGYGLTPKLLRDGRATDVEVSLKLTMMFGIPMLVGALIITQPLVYLYGPSYLVVVSITRVLAISTFLDLFTSISDSVITATVDVDRGKPKLKELAKSRLSLLPSINIVMGSVYLVILYLLLVSPLLVHPFNPEQVAFFWAVSLLSTKLPFALCKFWLARRVLKFRTPLKGIAKYSVASALMAVVLTLCLPYVTYVPSIYQFIIYPLVLVGVGGLIYMVTILIIDKEARQLAKAVLRLK